jgi:hypothetical protein
VANCIWRASRRPLVSPFADAGDYPQLKARSKCFV